MRRRREPCPGRSACRRSCWPLARPSGRAQDGRRSSGPPPPPLDDFETDANGDGVPDGWYNLRDGDDRGRGGRGRPAFPPVRERTRPGRPARLSRAFGVDGRKTEAIVIGLWVRLDGHPVRRAAGRGSRPADRLPRRRAARPPAGGRSGPGPSGRRRRWTRVAKRIAVPPGTRDAIMSVGLLGATGVLDVDGLTIDLVPVGGRETTNLVVNGDFELGDPDAGRLDRRQRRPPRRSPAIDSASALELAQVGRAGHDRPGACRSTPFARAGALAVGPGPRACAAAGGRRRRSSSSTTTGGSCPGVETGVPRVPLGGHVRLAARPGRWSRSRRGAVRAVLQFEKPDAQRLDPDRRREGRPPRPTPRRARGPRTTSRTTPTAGCRSPRRRRSRRGSALDASFLLDAPAGKHGFVTVARRPARLRARGAGPGSSASPCSRRRPSSSRERADALADRLARSGVNLVRLGDLDTPLGPDRSLFDDTRDDTKAFDPIALAKLDHLIAALKARGIYVALELQSVRRFRDGGRRGRLRPAPRRAAGRRPSSTRRSTSSALEAAEALLGHVNPETGLALRDDPVLAWVTLAGEISLFDLIDDPDALARRPTPPSCKALAQKSTARRGPAVLAGARVGALEGAGRRAPQGRRCRCRSPASRTGGASPSSPPRRRRPGST